MLIYSHIWAYMIIIYCIHLPLQTNLTRVLANYPTLYSLLQIFHQYCALHDYSGLESMYCTCTDLVYKKACANLPTINVGTKVNFADIIILKNSFVSIIRSVVRSTMIEGTTSWKCESYKQNELRRFFNNFFGLSFMLLLQHAVNY